MSSATSTSRSCATPSTRCGARSEQRYDFKGVTVDLTQAKDELTLVTDDEHRAAARQGPHRVEGDPAQPVAQDLRLGQGRAGRREQGPPDHQAPARPDRGRRQADLEAHPRRVPQGRSRRSRATPSASPARAGTSCRRSSPACASSTSPCRSSSRTTGRRAMPGARFAGRHASSSRRIVFALILSAVALPLAY